MAQHAPVPLAEALAHQNDPLGAHLERVAAGAREMLLPASDPELHKLAWLAGLCHDIAKATGWFQAYLRRAAPRSPETRHSALGAVWMLWATQSLPAWQRALLATVITRHHGRLEASPWSEVALLRGQARRDADDEPGLFERQLAATDLEGTARFLCTHLATLGIEPPPRLPSDPASVLAAIPRPRAWDRAHTQASTRDPGLRLRDTIDLLAVFGAMLGVDRLDTALDGSALARPELPHGLVERYVEQRFGPPRGALDRRRHDIAQEVLATWRAHPTQRLFTLTSPTGSGKTLAVLRAALDARSRATVPSRIVYALPFTSVIDQNAAIIGEVFEASGVERTSDRLLVHHHLSSFEFRTQDAEFAEDGAGSWLVEGWASELVVTTFHQFLYSIFSTGTQELKRFGRLAGAVVLLDEVQAIPLRYWNALREVFAAIAERLDTTFVLLTATRPLIFRPDDAVELLPSHPEHFAALSRTRLHCRHREPMTLTAFATQVAQPSLEKGIASLYVLNTRRAVAELYTALAPTAAQLGHELTALSTLLTPRDRLQRVRWLQERLAARLPTTVISTQLIEAGVSLSFPHVHRDFAPLDSIIQSAGCCNRNDEGLDGDVFLWRLTDEDAKLYTTKIYDGLLLQCTEEALGQADVIAESDFLGVSTRYFELCATRGEICPLDRFLAEGDFKAVADNFKLIEERFHQPVFICLDAHDEALWASYRSWLESPTRTRLGRQPWQRDFFERVVQIPSRSAPGEILCVGREAYDATLGLDPARVAGRHEET